MRSRWRPNLRVLQAWLASVRGGRQVLKKAYQSRWPGNVRVTPPRQIPPTSSSLETSDPGLPPAGRGGPPNAVRGDATASVPSGRPAPLHPEAQTTGPERRRAGAAGLPPGLLQAPSPLGLAAGSGGGQKGRVAGQSQADPPPLDRRRPACALSEAKEAAPGHRTTCRGHVPDQAQRRLGAKSNGRRDIS